METNTRLNNDPKGKAVDLKMCHNAIGSLIYLISSRHDILFVMRICTRYESYTKESHLNTVKRILRYIKGTQNVGLWFPRIETFNLVGYSNFDYDSNYVGCKLN